MREKAAWDITMNKLYENEVDIKRDLPDRCRYIIQFHDADWLNLLRWQDSLQVIVILPSLESGGWCGVSHHDDDN